MVNHHFYEILKKWKGVWGGVFLIQQGFEWWPGLQCICHLLLFLTSHLFMAGDYWSAIMACWLTHLAGSLARLHFDERYRLLWAVAKAPVKGKWSGWKSAPPEPCQAGRGKAVKGKKREIYKQDWLDGTDNAPPVTPPPYTPSSSTFPPICSTSLLFSSPLHFSCPPLNFPALPGAGLPPVPTQPGSQRAQCGGLRLESHFLIDPLGVCLWGSGVGLWTTGSNWPSRYLSVPQ